MARHASVNRASIHPFLFGAFVRPDSLVAGFYRSRHVAANSKTIGSSTISTSKGAISDQAPQPGGPLGGLGALGAIRWMLEQFNCCLRLGDNRSLAVQQGIWPIRRDELVSPAPRSSGRPQHFVTRIGRIERIWRIAPRAVMHAVATSPDDPFFWDGRSGRAGHFETRPERLLHRQKKCLYWSSVSSKARRYPDFIRKNSPNPNEFAQFAFNLLMRPDDHAGKSSRSSRAVSFHTVSRSG